MVLCVFVCVCACLHCLALTGGGQECTIWVYDHFCTVHTVSSRSHKHAVIVFLFVFFATAVY